MNTTYATQLDPHDKPSTVDPGRTAAGFGRLLRVYQQLGLNPEQALAAVRADVANDLAEVDAGGAMS